MLPNVQAVLCDDGFHLVSADHMLIAAAETLKVHVMQFRVSDARVKEACLLDELDDHLFLRPGKKATIITIFTRFTRWEEVLKTKCSVQLSWTGFATNCTWVT